MNRDPIALAGHRILITGAGGFVGHALVQALSGVDCTLIRLGRRPMAPVPGRCRCVDVFADLTESGWQHRIPGPVDAVVHLAAQTSAAVADADPEGDARINVAPVIELVTSFGEQQRPPAVILAGTVTQAGPDHPIPLTEAADDRPVTAYDRHKLMAEIHLREATARGLVRGVSLRLANIYGPGPAASRADRGILNRMIRRAYDGDPLTVFGTGRQIRDYLFVADAAAAFAAALIHVERIAGRHFVIGSGVGTSIVDAFQLAASRAQLRTGRAAPVVHVTPAEPVAPIDHRDCRVEAGAFRAATGWMARFSLQQGIDATLDWIAQDGEPNRDAPSGKQDP